MADPSASSPTSPILHPPSSSDSSPQAAAAVSTPPPWLRAPASALSPPTHLPAVPQPLPVPLLIPPHTFTSPTKRISSPTDISRFLSSPAARHFLGFIAALSSSARNLKISDPVPISPTITRILSLLNSVSRLADEIPPLPHPARYGNPAFRSFHDRLTETLTLDLLPPSAADEIIPYLLVSFGNPARIDYGTGHETSFAAFLFCLARLGLVSDSDYPALVTRVFAAYFDLIRKLIITYSLEPAGSHGVWGLDDYHFLPFVFGSAQLVGHKYMKPKSIHNPDIIDNFAEDYMYIACIAFIKKVKKGPFVEHSPRLDDISLVSSWSKVNDEMLKMYKAEVLEKVPVMQHFLFGSLIKWE